MYVMKTRLGKFLNTSLTDLDSKMLALDAINVITFYARLTQCLVDEGSMMIVSLIMVAFQLLCISLCIEDISFFFHDENLSS